MHSRGYRGNPGTHAQGREGLTTGECKLFTVFLTAFDFSTSAPLTTTVSRTLYCVLGMQIT